MACSLSTLGHILPVSVMLGCQDLTLGGTRLFASGTEIVPLSSNLHLELQLAESNEACWG